MLTGISGAYPSELVGWSFQIPKKIYGKLMDVYQKRAIKNSKMGGRGVNGQLDFQSINFRAESRPF